MGTIFLTIIKGDVCMKHLLEDTEQDDACGCTKCKSHGVDPHTGKWYAYINGKRVIIENHFGRMLDPEREAELDRMRNKEPLTEEQLQIRKKQILRDLDYYNAQLPTIIQEIKRKIRELEEELKEMP